MLAFIYLSLVLTSSWCYGRALYGDQVCNKSVAVDENRGRDCSSFEVLPENLTQGLICNSLSDTLQLIAQAEHDPLALEEDCVEVVISQGSYTIEGTVNLDRNVILCGRDGQVVSVILLTPATDPPEFMYSLSFRNLDFAGIENIEFSGSNGVIGFDNVSMVEISHSSFR